MNFSFSDDQVLLKNSVRSALDEQCKSAHVRAMMEDAKGYGEPLWSEMAKLGWLGLPFAEEYGGAGLGLVELCLVLEEMGRAAYPGPYVSSVVLGGLGLVLGGTEAQKQHWLPKLATAEVMAAVAVTEPDFGSDVAGIKVTATAASGADDAPEADPPSAAAEAAYP